MPGFFMEKKKGPEKKERVIEQHSRQKRRSVRVLEVGGEKKKNGVTVFVHEKEGVPLHLPTGRKKEEGDREGVIEKKGGEGEDQLRLPYHKKGKRASPSSITGEREVRRCPLSPKRNKGREKKKSQWPSVSRRRKIRLSPRKEGGKRDEDAGCSAGKKKRLKDGSEISISVERGEEKRMSSLSHNQKREI